MLQISLEELFLEQIRWVTAHFKKTFLKTARIYFLDMEKCVVYFSIFNI